MSDKLADIDYERIKHETEKAYLLVISGKDVWLPKSVVEVDEEDKTVTLPYHMAFERGLI